MRFIILVMLLLLSGPVLADNNKLKILGTYDNWTAYLYQDAQDLDNKVCYMSSEPIKSVGKYTTRGDVFLLVTHHAKEKVFDKINITTGYTYKKGSQPTLTIDKNKGVTLIPHADTAWTKDGATDQKLITQMRKGSTAVLHGSSVRGTATTDTFSLNGFSKAYHDIQKACGQE